MILSPDHSLTQEAHGHQRHKLAARVWANGHPLHESTVRGVANGLLHTPVVCDELTLLLLPDSTDDGGINLNSHLVLNPVFTSKTYRVDCTPISYSQT